MHFERGEKTTIPLKSFYEFLVTKEQGISLINQISHQKTLLLKKKDSERLPISFDERIHP